MFSRLLQLKANSWHPFSGCHVEATHMDWNCELWEAFHFDCADMFAVYTLEN